MQHKPCVFISSTIYDFSDLRSALRNYMEEMGFDVLSSECNDFPRQIDKNSYDACITTIDSCDYFILLIGSRVGGWFNETEKISITQAEYRHAYERLSNGNLKILTFVRSSIWTIREDRKALEEFVKESYKEEYELSDSDVQKITRHRSRFVNDADFIFNFITEVSRNTEMKKAIKDGTKLPEGNWLHQFSTFTEIVQSLRVAFQTTDNLSLVALKENLKSELVSNLQQLLHKHKGVITDIDLFYNAFRNNNTFTPSDISIYVSRHHMDCLDLALVYTNVDSSRISTQFIDAGIESGAFLDYDVATGTYVPSMFLIRLKELQVNLAKYIKSSGKSDIPKLLLKYKKDNSPGDPIEVSTGDLGIMAYTIDRYIDVCSLSKGILQSILGDANAVSTIALREISPFKGQDAGLKAERPTAEEVLRWITAKSI